MQKESFLDLVRQAFEMLLDRDIKERKLIYQIAKLDEDLRAAIIIAYESLDRIDRVR